jgi:CRP-like cAMP-binding protein
MSNTFVQLYARESEPKCAYLLEEGEVVHYISNTDKYALRGKGLVIGAGEIILQKSLNLPIHRLETTVAAPGSVLKKVSAEKVLSSLGNYSLLVNIAMILAKQVVLTNEIINRNRENLHHDEQTHREACLEYYCIMHAVKEEYDKRKLPWLKDFVTNYQTSLTYKQGEIFFKTEEPVIISPSEQLSDKMISYGKGQTIFEQGTCGTEMFIVQSGTIDVLVNGNKVATISDPGMAIGEIALLLGEKRTASLVAKSDTLLTRITKSDLKEIIEKDRDVFEGIVNSLARKHHKNVTVINDINSKLIERDLDLAPKKSRSGPSITRKP